MAFNRDKFAELLLKAKGDRSINSFGNQSKVDPGYISRLLRKKVETPPGPGVIKKLAENARRGVSYEEMMAAAGHLREPDRQEEIYKITNTLEQRVAEVLEKPLAEFLPVKKIPLLETFCESREEQNIPGYINVPRELDADFAFKVKDFAMVEAGIFPGDIAICRRVEYAAPGQMVVTRLFSGQLGVRYLMEAKGELKLSGANSLINELESQKPEILGIVLMIQKEALSLKQFKELLKRDLNEEIIPEDFLLEKLSESTGIPLQRLKTAMERLKNE
ncbi:MAG: hypothetical protein K6U74_20985 [Firmicutes bacterium]|nr:hypothetical protein [Bacillota bacterium]